MKYVWLGVAGAALLVTAAGAQPIVYTESDRSLSASAEIVREDPGGGDPVFISDSNFDGTMLQGLFERTIGATVADLGDGGGASAHTLSDLGSSSITFSAETSAMSSGIGRANGSVQLVALFTLTEAGLYDLNAALSQSGGDLFGFPSGGASVLLERDTGQTQTLPGFPFPIPIFETIVDLSAGNSTASLGEMRNLVAGDYILNISVFSSSEEASLNASDSASGSFSMSLVPGPASAVTLGLGALLGFRRRR